MPTENVLQTVNQIFLLLWIWGLYIHSTYCNSQQRPGSNVHRVNDQASLWLSFAMALQASLWATVVLEELVSLPPDNHDTPSQTFLQHCAFWTTKPLFPGVVLFLLHQDDPHEPTVKVRSHQTRIDRAIRAKLDAWTFWVYSLHSCVKFTTQQTWIRVMGWASSGSSSLVAKCIPVFVKVGRCICNGCSYASKGCV